MLDLTEAAKAPQDFVVSSPVAFMSQGDIEGIKTIREFIGISHKPVQYVAGWAGAMLLGKGLEKAKISPEMTVMEARKALRNALESIKNESLDGLTRPINFTPQNHRGTKGFKMYKVDWADRKFQELPGTFIPSEGLYKDLYTY